MTESESTSAARSASGKRLVISVVAAAAAGILLVFAIIMPAEYGIDPLGTGRLMGLD